ncbi:MAG: Crp/Fnr family transcriptional regulator [Hyphomicrobiaceae bacterium]
MLATHPDPQPRSHNPGASISHSKARERGTMTAPTDALVAGFASGATRTLKAKDHLFCEGDEATHVFYVEAGLVCIYRMISDGRRQVLDFAHPGDIVGLGALSIHAASAQATAYTRLRCLSRKHLNDLAARDPRLSARLYETLSEELSATREHLFAVSQCNATERLASFLLSLSRRNARRGEDATEIVLPMMRADIADFLGLTIETVSRTFTKLRCEGLIDIEHCVLVTIRDADSLAFVAAGSCAPPN